jgi:REP element-mobilizing transposase RayT
MDKNQGDQKMPRHARKQSTSNVYHIMVRGNERKNIFLDDEDRIRFLDTLQKMKEYDSYNVYAYCLMDNHVHLLIRELKDSIQRSMKRVCVSYIYYFNKKYRRVGHLFQDRYRSEAVEKDSYILAAARYIHNNPVNAKIVAKAEDYKWSSYQQYINQEDSKGNLVDCNFLLSMLFDTEDRAIELFKEFSKESVEDTFIEYRDTVTKTSAKEEPSMGLLNDIKRILAERGQSLEGFKDCRDKPLKKSLLKEIKEATNASLRDLSGILEISKDTIFRA